MLAADLEFLNAGRVSGRSSHSQYQVRVADDVVSNNDRRRRDRENRPAYVHPSEATAACFEKMSVCAVGSFGQRRTISCRVGRREGCRGDACGNAGGVRLAESFLVRTRDVLHVASLNVPRAASAVHVDMGATRAAAPRFQLQPELSTFALRILDRSLEGVVSAGGKE